MTTREEQLPDLPSRESDTHKGDYGRVLAIAGSRGMSGAAALVGMSALRGGAGLVTVACPESVWTVVAACEPSLMTWPLPESETGEVADGAHEQLSSLIDSADAIAIGPGLRTGAVAGELVRSLYRDYEQTLVCDADALNLLSSAGEWPMEHAGPRVLTPHPGEFAHMTGRSTAEIAEHREELATEFALAHGVVLVLKGYRTVLTDGDRLALNRTGNPGMATGGCGDVLTGLTLALVADARLELFPAVQLAVHLHGLAGDLAAAEQTQQALIASDLIDYLPEAWDEYMRG